METGNVKMSYDANERKREKEKERGESADKETRAGQNFIPAN